MYNNIKTLCNRFDVMRLGLTVIADQMRALCDEIVEDPQIRVSGDRDCQHAFWSAADWRAVHATLKQIGFLGRTSGALHLDAIEQ